MSAYLTEIAPWGEEIRVRECKNEGCNTVVYYDNSGNRFKELNKGQVHSCKFYNKRTGSPKQQGNNNQSQYNNTNLQQSSNNNTNGPVKRQTLEVLIKGQLEELRRAVDRLGRIAMFAESLDFRVKKIEERMTYSKVPTRPILSESESTKSQSDEEIVGGVQDV